MKSIKLFGLLLLPMALMLLALRPGPAASFAPAQSDQWQELDTTHGPGPRNDASAVNLDGAIYIFGGNLKQDKPDPVNELWKFDLETRAWSKAPAAGAVPPARYRHTAVARDGKMIIFGGMGADGLPLGDAWVFDPATATWETLAGAPPPARSSAGAATTDDGSIVVFAGRDSHASRNDTWIYDTETARWNQGADFPGQPDETFSPNAAVVGQQVLAFGGVHGIYAYNVDADAWRAIPVSGDAPTQRYLASSAQSPSPVSGAAGNQGSGERVWLFGGVNLWPPQVSAATWELNPATFTWTRRTDLPLALMESTAAAFQVRGSPGVLLFGGVQSDAAVSGRAFIYWPEGLPPTATPTPRRLWLPMVVGR